MYRLYSLFLGLFVLVVLLLGGGCKKDDESATSPEVTANPHVLVNGRLGAGFYPNCWDSLQAGGWAQYDSINGYLRMSYPPGHEGGAAYITVSPPQVQPRLWMNFADYDRILFRLRGMRGGEAVKIGIKDWNDPDDGSETKLRVAHLTAEWQDYTFFLRSFANANQESLYVVAEFVFGTEADTVDCSHITYLESLPPPHQIPSVFYVMRDGSLGTGLELGMNTSDDYTGWVQRVLADSCLRITYPPEQSWGSVFITAGLPMPIPRNWMDMSNYQTLRVTLRGAHGHELVRIGLKDKNDPDNGLEPTVTVPDIDTDWRDYYFFLSDFSPVDLTSLYVLTEFLFSTSEDTMDCRNIEFMSTPPPPHEETAVPIVMDNGNLSEGYGMGVDDSRQLRNWMSREVADSCFRMAYPDSTLWGAVFITVGTPIDRPRPWMNFHHFDSLRVTLRGAHGGESVQIGIKDKGDWDDGNETKKVISGLSTEWQDYTFALSEFLTADITTLYVVTEFVFASDPDTVDFRNVRFLP